MPFQKLCTNLQGFLGFSCSVCIKRRMQILVRMKYSRAEHAPKRFGALRTAATKQEQSNLSDSPRVKTARTGADLNLGRGRGGEGGRSKPLNEKKKMRHYKTLPSVGLRILKMFRWRMSSEPRTGDGLRNLESCCLKSCIRPSGITPFCSKFDFTFCRV